MAATFAIESPSAAADRLRPQPTQGEMVTEEHGIRANVFVASLAWEKEEEASQVKTKGFGDNFHRSRTFGTHSGCSVCQPASR